MRQIFLILLLPFLCAPAAQSQVIRPGFFKDIEGELKFLTDHEGGLKYIFALANATEHYQLLLDRIQGIDISKLIEWSRVAVTGNLKDDGKIDVEDVQLLAAREEEGSAPEQMRTITLRVNQLCDWRLAWSMDDIRRRWFNKYGSGGITMEGYYETCSLGRTLFTEDNNLIVDNIQIPCNGRLRNGMTFDSRTRCENNEFYAWAEHAESFARGLGIDMSKFTTRIILLPDGIKCGWAGLANVGCGGACYSWIKTGVNLPIGVIAHEVGHNQLLLHSNTAGREYGDYSCTMGISGQVCMNAPQAWKLGWRDAAQVVDVRRVTSPIVEYSIPNQQDAYNSFIRVMKDDSLSYFLSYRMGDQQYERDLRDTRGALVVHERKGGIQAVVETTMTRILRVTEGANIFDDINIVFLRVNARDITVRVCKGPCPAAPPRPPSPSPPSPPPPKPAPSPRPPPTPRPSPKPPSPSPSPRPSPSPKTGPASPKPPSPSPPSPKPPSPSPPPKASNQFPSPPNPKPPSPSPPKAPNQSPSSPSRMPPPKAPSPKLPSISPSPSPSFSSPPPPSPSTPSAPNNPQPPGTPQQDKVIAEILVSNWAKIGSFEYDIEYLETKCEGLRLSVETEHVKGMRCKRTLNNRSHYAQVFEFDTVETMRAYARYLLGRETFKSFVEQAEIICDSTVRLVYNKHPIVTRSANALNSPCIAAT